MWSVKELAQALGKSRHSEELCSEAIQKNQEMATLPAGARHDGFAALCSDLHQEITGLSIDTRLLNPGDLFIALMSEKGDGHHYVEEAFKKGAVAALVSKPVALQNKNILGVSDTLKALYQLAHYSRHRSKAKIIAVTGSAGKTTTKEFLRHCLSAFNSVSASLASYNNHLGVPLSLARMPADTHFGVFEVGMNHVGEIAPLSQLIQPDIAIITTVSEAHIGNMGSLETIAQEKADIFSGLNPKGTAIIPSDLSCIDILSAKAKHFVTFGKKDSSDIQLLHYKPIGTKGYVEASVFGKKYVYECGLAGEHSALNSLIVLAVGHIAGLDFNRLLETFQTMEPLQGRGKRYILPYREGNVTLIDDAYNANPASMKAGLSLLFSAPLQKKGRYIAVLGDMLELGEMSHLYHQEIGQFLKKNGVYSVFACGSAMSFCYEELLPSQKGLWAKTPEELKEPLLKQLQPEDIILIKGSYGSRVSILVDEVRKFLDQSFNVKVA
ncbi:MAG: UDP-N-acetylmuramoyl-tripeptide--D-alanyl-D-alanine ligase [Proteobacteria bacterium]|nr:UDP-N-acetylmuramoyl-tripeptide--D-alanyl-D-alanine ligase [Pseudomonadota bacterium]